MAEKIEENAQERKDRRVRKTKNAVHNALLQLMKSKKISKISVLELTEAADINRKTFYNHYSDIYAVLDEVENECVEHLVSLFRIDETSEYMSSPKSFFKKLIRELQENKDFYTLLIQSEAHSHISQKLIRREKDVLRGLIDSEHMDETLVDYFLNYISAGTISVINSWFLSEERVPEDTLATFFGSLFSSVDAGKLIQAARA